MSGLKLEQKCFSSSGAIFERKTEETLYPIYSSWLAVGWVQLPLRFIKNNNNNFKGSLAEGWSTNYVSATGLQNNQDSLPFQSAS